MKRFVYSSFAVVALSLLSAGIISQAWGEGGRCPLCPASHGICMHNTDSLKEKLGLSQKQVDQVKAIRQKYHEKYRENRGDREKIRELLEQHWREVQSVLNDEQKAKYNEIHKQHMDKMKARRQMKGK